MFILFFHVLKNDKVWSLFWYMAQVYFLVHADMDKNKIISWPFKGKVLFNIYCELFQ